MRLERLCEFRLSYDEHGFVLVAPFGGQEGQGYGTGTGAAFGDKLAGPVRWSNYPRLTDDGVFMPDLRGVITTPEGPVLFEIRGVSLPPEPGSTERKLTMSIVFRTQADEHKWLNHALAVQHGVIDAATRSIFLSTDVCVAE